MAQRIDFEAWLPVAGLALLGLGMILVVAGVVKGALFVPGTWLILLGLLAFAAAGIVRLLRTRGETAEP